VANILMGVVDYGMNIQEAVNAARFHQQWLPDVTSVEQGFSPDIVKRLEEMGHHVEFGVEESGRREPNWSDGECIMVDPKRGDRLGASDQRNGGRAIGF
jgi:gamma-glutamyltranspeptidase/glutathione hydrolase